MGRYELEKKIFSLFQDRDDILYDEIEAENEPKSNLKKMIVEHCLGNLQANISEFGC